MGLMGRILGLGGAVRGVGSAVTGVAEVFVGNRAERDAADAEQLAATLEQYAAEFAGPRAGWFDGAVNGLNRLPRPMLALGTLALFGYAMAEPSGFSVRMRGLALVPEPLWWLLGAIVSFYFGARELHYRRESVALAAATPAAVAGPTAPRGARVPEADAGEDAGPERASLFGRWGTPVASAPVAGAADPNFNAAVEEWRRQRA